VGLLVGLGHAVYLGVVGLHGDTSADADRDDAATGETEHSTEPRGATHRDEIAAEPMLSVPQNAALPSEEASSGGPDAPTITIPAGTGLTGPGFVMTGFPGTPEGAIGQLAQLDTAVLQSMSPQTAEEVYDSWALPGGVGAKAWWITSSVAAFLDSSEMGKVKSSSASVTVEPAAALVKGTDGTDWTTVCVLLKVSATYRSQGQIAFGHCERMQWVGGRWMLAPGTPPAAAPATWPGTDLANQAGWRTWVTDPSLDSSGDPAEEPDNGQGGEHR
jgi:hypothetical protein